MADWNNIFKGAISPLASYTKENFPRSSKLSPGDSQLQERSIDQVLSHPEHLTARYKAHPRSEGGKIVNADVARELFKPMGYQGHNAAAFHEASSALSKHLYHEALKRPGKTAILYQGGSGSGKTSAVKNITSLQGPHSQAATILDSNLSTEKSAQRAIRAAHEAGKTPHVVYVYRDPAESWHLGVLKRMLTNNEEGGRVVPLSVFKENHIGSYETAKKLFKENKVKMSLLDNSLGKGKAALMNVEKFKNIKYNNGIWRRLAQDTNELYKNGAITKEQHAALLG